MSRGEMGQLPSGGVRGAGSTEWEGGRLALFITVMWEEIPAEHSREGRTKVGLEGLGSRPQSCLTPILLAWAEGLLPLHRGNTEPHVLPGPSAGSPPLSGLLRETPGQCGDCARTGHCQVSKDQPLWAPGKSPRINRCGLPPRPPCLAWPRSWGMGARCQASTGRARAGPLQLGSGRDTAGGPASVGTGW